MTVFGADVRLALEAIWKVLLWSLILGAGLPALYALAVRSLAWGAGGDAETSHAPAHPIGKVVGAVLFFIVLYCVAAGIVFIVAAGQGNDISFAHVIPTIRPR